MLIEPDEVAAVMLANRWVHVAPNTLEIHTREWFKTEDHPEIWSFVFQNDHGEWLAGPLDSIQAVRTRHRRSIDNPPQEPVRVVQ